MLENILYQFNDREYAIIFWLFLFFIFFLFKKGIRKSFRGFFSKFLLQIIFIITSYNILITLFFYKIGIWNIDYFKESLYWFFGSSLVFFFNINKVDEGVKFIKTVIFQMIGFTSILAFILNTYTFSFIIELILQPVLFSLTLMIAFAESYKNKEPKYDMTLKVLNYILFIFIIIIFIKIIFSFLNSPDKLFSSENTIHLLYPIFYITLFYPFLYFFRLLMNYETLFVKIKVKNNIRFQDYFYVKRRIFKFCGLNLKLLNKFSNGRLFWMENKEDINKIILEFRSTTKNI